ncbi:MAG: DNA methylase, partial [Bacteroidales bacterium]|nr:DNA methylase [Bacteroidales bacterium]
MEGLEVNIKELTSTYKNKDFRIDSDFWTKEQRKNPNLKYQPIGELLENSQYGISISMNEDGIGTPIYRMNEIHNMLCDKDVSKHAELSNIEIEKFTLNDKDVLFNRTNSYQWVGRTGLYRKIDSTNYTFASYLVRFVPNNKIIKAEYLTAFLNSKQGKNEIIRRARQSINQTNVN